MKKIYILLCTAVLAASCSEFNCNTTNPVFVANLPDSERYKTELARLIELEGANNPKYFIGGYSENDGMRQLAVNVQGDSICAEANLLVKGNATGMEGVIKSKGMGYRNAELSGLEFDIVRQDGNILFIYKGVSRIID